MSTKFALGTEGVQKVKLAKALPATGSMAVISGWGTTAVSILINNYYTVVST